MLDKLVNEIKQNYGDRTSLYDSELREYRDRYYTHCLNQLEDRPSGFFGWVSFSNDVTKKFDEELSKLGIKIMEDPIKPLHNHELKQSGMNRLSELERKFK